MAVLWVAYPPWVRILQRTYSMLGSWMRRIEGRHARYTNARGERVYLVH